MSLKLIALIGMVSVEKAELATGLAHYFTRTGQSVTVIDNITHFAIDPAQLTGESLIQLKGDMEQYLIPALEHVSSDVALLAVSETAHPDDVFMVLEDAREAVPDLDLRTLALVDTRTCD